MICIAIKNFSDLEIQKKILFTSGLEDRIEIYKDKLDQVRTTVHCTVLSTLYTALYTIHCSGIFEITDLKIKTLHEDGQNEYKNNLIQKILF